MVIRYIQDPLMISPENINLYQIKLKKLISFKALFNTLLALFFAYTKN